VELLTYLLEFNPNEQVLHQDVGGRLPLHWVCGSGCEQLAERLLAFSPLQQSRHQDKKGYTPLYLACSRQLDGTVASLLQLDNLQRLFQNRDGRLPIHAACLLGSYPIVQMLLEDLAPAQLSQRDRLGNLPLHDACVSGCLPVVDLLLQKQHVPHMVEGGYQRLPLHMACIGGNLDILRLVLSEEQIEALLQEDSFRKTPLILACENSTNAEALVQELLTVHPEKQIEAACDFGRPLHRACDNGRVEVARLLLEKAPHLVFQTDQNSRLPLQIACAQGTASMVRVLLQCHPHQQVLLGVNEQGDYRDRPINLAFERGALDILRELLLYQVDPQISVCN